MNSNSRKAYTEVCEILKHLPKDEFNKIPKEIIANFEKNKDRNYYFTYDLSQSLGKQKVLRQTNAIIVDLFQKYFATNIQRQKINLLLKYNEIQYKNKLKEKSTIKRNNEGKR